MTHRERAITALNLQTPDMVPTFELEFQLAEELLGRHVPATKQLENASGKEFDKLLNEIVETTLQVTNILDYSIVNAHFLGGHEGVRLCGFIFSTSNVAFKGMPRLRDNRTSLC